MSDTPSPVPAAPAKKTNRLGLELASYRGSKTTLCAGCGHNAITERIIDACFEMGVDAKKVFKLSGIGCSSKSPAYFLNQSHGFNSVHGRMPSVATGAMLANKSMMAIGVSGDGDTGAIGIGQFVHLMRRNLPIIYIIEDNGCYGLTKGQFSPTADLGSKAKNGVVNDLPPIDTCALAIELGATFVARSFSGDKKQLLSILKAAISHRGTCMIDVISPCVTFNDHEGSTKSYAYAKDHDEALGEVTFVPFFEDITVEYEPGTTTQVKMHDGSHLFLKKIAEDYDPQDKLAANRLLHETARRGEFATGIIYVEPDRDDFLTQLNTVDTPLAFLPTEKTRPPKSVLDELMNGLKSPEMEGTGFSPCRGVGYNRPDMSERTFAIVKPDAVMAGYTGRILARIEENGFTIRAMRMTHLSKREAEGFYAVHSARPFFGSLTEFMSSGPCVVMCLEAPDAIKKWRMLMGATDPAKADAGTLRKEFGASIEHNATHGSDAPETAAFELGYFFRGMEL